MSSSMELPIDTLTFAGRVDQLDCFPQKGQKTIFEEEEAEVIREKPLFVIRTKNRVVCGALQDQFEYVGV